MMGARIRASESATFVRREVIGAKLHDITSLIQLNLKTPGRKYICIQVARVLWLRVPFCSAMRVTRFFHFQE